MADRAQNWADRAHWLGFVPVLSHPDRDWRGRIGHVHRAVLEDNHEMSNVDVYACGNPLMVAAARSDFLKQAGLPEARFYSDAFVDSGRPETACDKVD
jgi:NAD(P)H-flavin reductase